MSRSRKRRNEKVLPTRPRRRLLDRATVVLLAGLAAASIVYAANVVRVPQYRSVARLLITPNPQLYEGRDFLAALETLERTGIQTTFEEVLNSDRIRAAALDTVPFPTGSREYYLVETTSLESANVLLVTAEGPSPTATAQLSNEVVRQGLGYLASRYPMYLLEVLDDAAPAGRPFAPSMLRDVALALLAGSTLGAAFVLAASRLATARDREARRELVDRAGATGQGRSRPSQRADP